MDGIRAYLQIVVSPCKALEGEVCIPQPELLVVLASPPKGDHEGLLHCSMCWSGVLHPALAPHEFTSQLHHPGIQSGASTP